MIMLQIFGGGGRSDMKMKNLVGLEEVERVQVGGGEVGCEVGCLEDAAVNESEGVGGWSPES